MHSRNVRTAERGLAPLRRPPRRHGLWRRSGRPRAGRAAARPKPAARKSWRASAALPTPSRPARPASPSPDRPSARPSSQSLRAADIGPADVGHVNAHGLSTVAARSGRSPGHSRCVGRRARHRAQKLLRQPGSGHRRRRADRHAGRLRNRRNPAYAQLRTARPELPDQRGPRQPHSVPTAKRRWCSTRPRWASRSPWSLGRSRTWRFGPRRTSSGNSINRRPADRCGHGAKYRGARLHAGHRCSAGGTSTYRPRFVSRVGLLHQAAPEEVRHRTGQHRGSRNKICRSAQAVSSRNIMAPKRWVGTNELKANTASPSPSTAQL